SSYNVHCCRRDGIPRCLSRSHRKKVYPALLHEFRLLFRIKRDRLSSARGDFKNRFIGGQISISRNVLQIELGHIRKIIGNYYAEGEPDLTRIETLLEHRHLHKLSLGSRKLCSVEKDTNR